MNRDEYVAKIDSEARRRYPALNDLERIILINKAIDIVEARQQSREQSKDSEQNKTNIQSCPLRKCARCGEKKSENKINFNRGYAFCWDRICKECRKEMRDRSLSFPDPHTRTLSPFPKSLLNETYDIMSIEDKELKERIISNLCLAEQLG